MKDINPKALYVHIPFCISICGYCDFAKCKYDNVLVEKYLASLFLEIDMIKQTSFETIYIGGGTPTCLNEAQLERLLNKLSRFKNVKEYTIEINPETFSLEKAFLMKKYNINRVSIGVQSFNEELLKHMERSHHNIDVINTFKYLDAVGIKNISIDLMFGFNNQNMEMLAQDLETAVNSRVTHISIYDLEIYPKTKFGFENYQKDERKCAVMYDFIMQYLNEHSYKQYEVSNFAIAGFESRHNITYWLYEDYIGVGLSASGKMGNYRYTNTKNFIEYFNSKYRKEEENLSNEDLYFETIMMNLRLLQGINIEDYNNRYHIGLLQHYKKAVDKNLKCGLLEIKDGYLKTTKRGLRVLNDILVDFMDYIC